MSFTIQQLIDQKEGSIFLLNTADTVIEGGGDVHISVPGKDGNVQTVSVRKSWLPMEATAIVPRQALLDAPAFMDSLAKKAVRAISREEYDRLHARPSARAELARLQAVQDAVKEASRGRGIGRNVSITSSAADDEDEVQAKPTVHVRGGQQMPRTRATEDGVINLSDIGDDEAETVQAGVDQDISAGFKAWVNKLNTLELADAISELQRRGKISKAEAAYLAEKTDHERIRTFLKKQAA